MPTAAEVFELFRQAGERGDVDAFLDLLADDVLMEWMYPLPGSVSQMRGRERLREYFGDRSEVARSRRSTYRDVVLHHSTDPEVVIAEYARDIVTVGTGETTTLVCVAVMRMRDGKIAHFRDYFQAVA